MNFRFGDGHEVVVDAEGVLESHALLKSLREQGSSTARALVDRIDRAASGEGDRIVSVPDDERATLREALDRLDRDGVLTPALAALRDEALV